MSNFCQLWLACATSEEASNIAKVLLEKHLIVCAKQVSVGSDFLWKDKVDHNDEVLVVMDSREDLFDKIEAEVKKLHSYDTFVLQSIPVNKVSTEADRWMKDNLSDTHTSA